MLGHRWKPQRAVRYYVTQVYWKQAILTAMALPLIWKFALVQLPTLGLVSDHVSTLSADRYTYIPDMLILPPLLARLSSEKLLVLLAVNVFYTRKQVNRWRSNELLLDDMRAFSPEDPLPLVHRGIYTKNVTLLKEASRLSNSAKIWLNIAHFTQEHEAADALQKARALEPRMPGLREETTSLLQRSSLQVKIRVAKDAKDASYLSDLAAQLKSEDLFRDALQFDPLHYQANYNLASLLAQRGALKEARPYAVTAGDLDLLTNIDKALSSSLPKKEKKEAQAGGLVVLILRLLLERE